MVDIQPRAAPEAGSSVLPRAAARNLEALLQSFPVVVVSGPRRVGKSTLVRTAKPTSQWTYRSLDDLDNLERARAAPEQFVGSVVPAVIDEVQRAPDLVLAIKALVDRSLDPSPGQFVLTGSTDLLNDPRISDSLAGRAGYLRLGPLTRSELGGNASAGCWSEFFRVAADDWVGLLRTRDASPARWQAAVAAGGLPQVVRARDAQERARILLAYVDTYLERDLRDLAQIADLADFRRFMRGTALRTGNLANIAELARDLSLSATTVGRWLNLLQVSFLVARVEAFARNRTSRLIKSPKLYWCDPALGLFLSGNDEPGGAFLENLILADLLVWRELHAPRPDVMHWRATSGREVDFVIERANRLLAVEVKATGKPKPNDWRHLRAFMDEYGEDVVGGLLLHAGEETFAAATGIVAVPWWRVL